MVHICYPSELAAQQTIKGLECLGAATSPFDIIGVSSPVSSPTRRRRKSPAAANGRAANQKQQAACLLPPSRADHNRKRAIRHKASFLNPAILPTGAVNLETLHRELGSVLFDFLVDTATFMNNAGRFHPGQRAIGKRYGMSAATASRRIKALVASGVLTKHDPGGRETCRYQIVPRYLHAVLEARLRFRSDWYRYWRKPGAAATAFTQNEHCFTDETKGEAGSTRPSFEPSESLNGASAEEFQILSGCAGGLASCGASTGCPR
jgi:hypothetical protein